MWFQNKNKKKKKESKYLNPSDIVNSAGGSYVIKEKENESALHEIAKEINNK